MILFSKNLKKIEMLAISFLNFRLFSLLFIKKKERKKKEEAGELNK
jgi:hypothetical protein